MGVPIGMRQKSAVHAEGVGSCDSDIVILCIQIRFKESILKFCIPITFEKARFSGVSSVWFEGFGQKFSMSDART